MNDSCRDVGRVMTDEPEPRSLLSVIARAASDPAVDVSKMETLLRMQKELMADQARAQFNQAFARLQLKLPRVKKNGEVRYPVNKNNPDGPKKKAFSYAKYEDIDELIRPLLNEEGFSLTYTTEPQQNGTILIIGTLLHVGGHEKKASIGPLPLDTSGGKNNLQAANSTFSYGKRYTETMLLNLVFEGDDDDGVTGGMQFIDAASVKALSDLLIETKSSIDDFCRFMAVGGLAEIEVKDYPAAINALMAKRARGAAKGGAP